MSSKHSFPFDPLWSEIITRLSAEESHVLLQPLQERPIKPQQKIQVLHQQILSQSPQAPAQQQQILSPPPQAPAQQQILARPPHAPAQQQILAQKKEIQDEQQQKIQALQQQILAQQQQLLAQQQQIQAQQYEIEALRQQQHIKDVYGKRFCNIVGLDPLCRLPIVLPSQVNLDNVDNTTYPSLRVLPSHLKDVSAVRGVMGVESPRPFIAIKVEILDPNTREVIDVVVELILKRYSIKEGCSGSKGDFEHLYVTALTMHSAKEKKMASTLYGSGGMIDKELALVRKLLDGETIESSIGNFLVRKYSNNQYFN